MTVIISGDNGVSDVDGSAGTPAIRGTDANTGIFFPAADTIAFSEGGAEAMRIDSSGRVGIGTTSPNSQLNVSASANAQFELTATSGGPFRHYLRTQGNDLQIRASSGVIQFYTGNDDGLSSTERARITSDGNFLLANTNPNETTSVGVRLISNGAIRSTRSESTNVASTLDVWSTGASLYRFYVDMGGTVHATNNTISAISDIRHKENIRDLDVGLAEIMQLQPRVFDWKEGQGKNTQNDRGFIAQEFEQVFPDLIDEWKDPAPEGEEPYKSMRQDLIPVLVKAIQELKAINDAQASRIETLEAKVAALEAK